MFPREANFRVILVRWVDPGELEGCGCLSLAEHRSGLETASGIPSRSPLPHPIGCGQRCECSMPIPRMYLLLISFEANQSMCQNKQESLSEARSAFPHPHI